MPKSLFFICGLFFFYFSCSHARLYTYEVRQQIATDSLRVLDSLYVADSTRIADSLTLVRYESSDRENSARTLAQERERAKEDSARKATVPIAPSEGDIVSARSIVIPDGHECATAIDSVQRVIDSLQVELYQKDFKFAKMADFSFEDKKRYFDFLVRNHYKDSAQIFSWCEMLHAMLLCEQSKMRLLIKTQQNENTKSFLMAHLKKTQDKLADLANVMLGLSSRVPESVTHSAPQRLPE